ncbi:MAG: hypothetical protein LBF24_01185 [Puniceicoccales bacterium]|jgi:opacity protein-like surface antigen|nr:hypothetical protein [Puniceicoccales bacterium]
MNIRKNLFAVAALGLAIAPSVGAAFQWPHGLQPYVTTGATCSFLGNGELIVNREKEDAAEESYDASWNPCSGCRFSAGLWLPVPKYRGSMYGELEYQTNRTAKTESFGPISENEPYMEFSSDTVLLNLYCQSAAISNFFQPYIGLGCGAGFLKGAGCFYSENVYAFRESRTTRFVYKCTAGLSFELRRDVSIEAECSAILFPGRKNEKSIALDNPSSVIISKSLPKRSLQLSAGICNTF